MEGSRKLRGRIFSSRFIVAKLCCSRKKVLPDGNKLAAGVSAELESLKTEPASKWLNLAFVGARNQSRSLAHNLTQ